MYTSRKQFSKPLHPRGYGIPFVPDKMPKPVRVSKTKPRKMSLKMYGKEYTRGQRKRQRRIDEYMIQLGLEMWKERL